MTLAGKESMAILGREQRLTAELGALGLGEFSEEDRAVLLKLLAAMPAAMQADSRFMAADLAAAGKRNRSFGPAWCVM